MKLNLFLIGLLACGVIGYRSQSSAAQTPDTCPDEHFVDVSTYEQTQNYPAPAMTVTCDEENLIITSNGIPTFEFVAVTPSALQAQNYNWTIPLTPQDLETPAEVPLGGPIGFTVTGLPLFGPTESPMDGYADPMLDNLLDYCNGHTAQRGDYHFHAAPTCLFEEYENQVGLVVGYAFDGYPILAPYLCEDANCTTIREVQSSWVLTNPDVRAAWEANEYVEGSGDLDQCNGMVMEDGSYAYFATRSFPYFLGCYRAAATIAQMPGGQMGGQGQGGQGQPPTGGQGQPGQGQGGNGQQPPPPPGGGQGQPPNGGQPPPPPGGGNG